MSNRIPPTRYITVATAGHVDHGKTSLLKVLTGIDPDRLKEEKERQMTTDIGFANLQLPGEVVVGFIDVPGHGKFLKNMLCGVGGIDLALLVVASDEGVMPQTRQHAKILSLLSVKQVVVVLTKVDLCDELQILATKQEVGLLLNDLSISSVAYIRISCINKTGFDELRQVLSDCSKQIEIRPTATSTYFPIDRVFSKTGFGTVVTGTLVKGKLGVGDKVYLQPDNCPVRIKRLESFGKPIELAFAGQRLACNISLKQDLQLARGQVISDCLNPAVKQLVVSLSGWEDELKSWPQLSGQDIRLYHGTSECHGRISWVEELSVIQGSQQVIAQIMLNQPLVAAVGDRFILRLSNDSICGGVILMRDRQRWLTRMKTKPLAASLLQTNYQAAIVFYISNCPQIWIKEADLQRFVPELALSVALESLLRQKQLVRLDDYWLLAVNHLNLIERLLEEVSRCEAVAMEKLRYCVKPPIPRAVCQILMQEMIERQQVVKVADKLHLPEPSDQVVDVEMSALQVKVMDILARHACLELTELQRQAAVSASSLQALMKVLQKQNLAAIVNYEFAACNFQINKAQRILTDLWQSKNNITPGDFKESLGTSRKYAMALLAYFDDHHITRRTNTGRVLLRPAAS